MNVNSQLMNEVLSFASAPEVVRSLVIDKRMEQATSIPELPPLQDILREFGPLPEEALLFGLADDGFPVLLNLLDPTPGPILIAGDSNVGKTDFLRALARYVVTAHQFREIQYGVITNRNYEWKDYFDYPHTIGVFSMSEKGAIDLIQALSLWIEMKKSNQQTVLLLIDGLEEFLFWNSALKQELQKILLSGPGKNVWPIATINLERIQGVEAWLDCFYTRVFGYTKHSDVFGDSRFCFPRLDALTKGMEFVVKEDTQWIRFRIPTT
jgi:hypothetical protein